MFHLTHVFINEFLMNTIKHGSEIKEYLKFFLQQIKYKFSVYDKMESKANFTIIKSKTH